MEPADFRFINAGLVMPLVIPVVAPASDFLMYVFNTPFYNEHDSAPDNQFRRKVDPQSQT